MSWLKISPASPFSLENIPFGIVTRSKSSIQTSPAVAVGEHVLILKELAKGGALSSCPSIQQHLAVFELDTLNEFAALGRSVHQALRLYLRALLLEDTPFPSLLRDNALLRSKAIYDRPDCQMHLPMRIGDYTDFYAGVNHAVNVGTLFRGAQNALQPNYTHLPVGYHGRASTVRPSGTAIRRPWGQILPAPGATSPVFSPSRKLDFELELAAFVSHGNGSDGQPISLNAAEDHIFGYVLMNDWSARDIQAWEYVPLGPFNSKNFATTISPWVVLTDALEPFRRGTTASTRNESSSTLLPYLEEREYGKGSLYDIELSVELTPAGGKVSSTLSRTNAAQLLYSMPQMLAHHTITGCEMNSGDLLGSGTISGLTDDSLGSLLEMTANGKKKVEIQGASRTFLEDGDEINLTGQAGEPGRYVGFGDCRGLVLPPLGLTVGQRGGGT